MRRALVRWLHDERQSQLFGHLHPSRCRGITIAKCGVGNARGVPDELRAPLVQATAPRP